MNYFEMRKKINSFIEESGISAYDVCRIARDLCCCRTCVFYVQHYAKEGEPVDFGHCRKNNRPKSVNPNMQSCGYWTLEG